MNGMLSWIPGTEIPGFPRMPCTKICSVSIPFFIFPFLNLICISTDAECSSRTSKEEKKKLAVSEFLFYMADIRSYSFATIKDKIEEKIVRYIFCKYFFVDTVPLALSPKFKKITAVFWVDDGPARASMEGGGGRRERVKSMAECSMRRGAASGPVNRSSSTGKCETVTHGERCGAFVYRTHAMFVYSGRRREGGGTQIIYCNECKR